MRLPVLYVFVLFFCQSALSQKRRLRLQPETKDFYPSIAQFDLSDIWCSDSVFQYDVLGGEGRIITRPEPLGFIGTSYSRLQIHVDSVSKSKTYGWTYSFYGKTKWNGSVSRFKGELTILASTITKQTDTKGISRGKVHSKLVLFESCLNRNCDTIKGEMTSSFLFDNNQILYDAMELGFSDSFCNNQFVGFLISGKNGKQLKCNWGDYRIPESKDLDIGAGFFVANPKYEKEGWKSYNLSNEHAFLYEDEKFIKEIESAREYEFMEWWK